LAKPYYQDDAVIIYYANCYEVLPPLPDKSIDLLVTDPPYGIGFMGKDWDKALPDKQIWVECLRVLKDGAFAFVMSIPRADCLSRMIISLEDAGFWVNFTPIFHAFASGFPKAQNISKAVDKKLGTEREVIGYKESCGYDGGTAVYKHRQKSLNGQVQTGGMPPITKPATPQAKALNGSYGGFQPKPAVEVVIVAQKPMSEKTYADQALKNKKGITWLDEGRIPYENEGDKSIALQKNQGNALINRDKLYGGYGDLDPNWQKSGRFPANLCVEDDVLNDGKGHQSSPYPYRATEPWAGSWDEHSDFVPLSYSDSGSFSRYFDLDKWFEEKLKELPASVQKTFPFLIVPKASKSEKNKGLNYNPEPIKGRDAGQDIRNVPQKARSTSRINQHPTVKPLKLMSYLITLGSREGDIILDPFLGSGTTALGCKLLNRKCIGIEIEEKYCEIAAKRCSQSVMRLET